jgi:methyl-accepting chemotaxis protein
MRFPQFRLRTRIFFGYGVLIALLLGIAAYGSYGLSIVGEEIDKMDGIAGNANRQQELALKMEVARRGLADYARQPNQDTMREVTDAETRADVLLKESAEFTLSEQRRAIFKGVSDKLHGLAEKQDRLAALQELALQERARMSALSDDLKTSEVRLVDAVTQDGAESDGAAATAVRLALRTVEATGLRFLTSPAPAALAAFKTNAQAAAQAMTTLSASASPIIKSAVPPLVETLTRYTTAFDKTAAALIEADAIYIGQIRPVLRDMQGVTGKALDKLIAGFRATSEKAFALSADTLMKQLAASAAATVVGLLLAYLIARTIIRPINGMTAAMTNLATGDTTSEVPGRNSTDEIGEMARAVEVFRQQAMENAALAAEQQREHIAKERRQKAMDMHTQDFGSSVSGVMEGFMAAAATMRQAAVDVSEGARRTRASTTATVEGAASSARDLNSVAAAAEEMAVSIQEISRQVTLVTNSVEAAVNRAADTDAKVAGLSAAADRIGDVVRIISDIAGQTNLLALNATIEAARAGDAGKGFAVVAGEVKALASQTARATSEIGDQIIGIRNATADAVAAVREVAAAISQVESVAAAIAVAVSEQASATREITTSVQQVTATTSLTSDAMRDVLLIVTQSDASSLAALNASEEVSRTAETLRSEVTNFLTAVSSGDDAERRLYERVEVDGLQVTLRFAGRPPAYVEVKDVSRGGVRVAWDAEEKIGTDVDTVMPSGSVVSGRVARRVGDTLAIAFRQDVASLECIDQSLASILGNNMHQAA